MNNRMSKTDEVIEALIQGWADVEGEPHARRLVAKYPGIVTSERDAYDAAQKIIIREFPAEDE